jgi:penicillin-binding protein 1C
VGDGFVGAVWIGRPDGAARPGSSGRTEALPLLFDVFDQLHPAPGAAIAFDDPGKGKPEQAAPGLAKLDHGDEVGPSILFLPDNAEIVNISGGVARRARRRGRCLVCRGRADREGKLRACDLAPERGGFRCRRGRREGRTARRVRVRKGEG